MTRNAIVLASTLFLACSGVHYVSPEFPAQTADHEVIAVLPVEMIFTGKVPAGVSPDQVLAIEEAESTLFQMSLYNRLLHRSSAHRRHPIRISIQPPHETNRLLAESELTVREAWSLPCDELEGVLGVDAVVRTRVEKARYLSDLESYGIHVGVQVMHEATKGRFDWAVPPGLGKTYDIWADSFLEDVTDSEVLWKVAVHRSTDWQRSAEDVIEGITKGLAKKFPYRAAVPA